MGTPGAVDVKHLPVNQALRDYLVRSGTPDPVARQLAARTAALGDAAGMMVPVEQAALLSMLTRLLAARVAVDIGTFTGMSALAMARGLAPGGRVVTCDVTDRWSGLARKYWQLAGVDKHIEFRRGPATRTLREFAENSVDLVFVDADKMNYPAYYQASVPLLRAGGLLVVDNVLLDGYVLDPELADRGLPRRCAQTLRDFNSVLAADERLDAVMLPIGDGLTVAQKR